MAAKIATLHMHIHFPGSDSLKAKRRRLLPLMERLRREFNVSVAEVDLRDKWADALVCCVLVNTEIGQAQRSLQKVVDWLEKHWPDVDLIGEEIEVLP
ncbi:MAG: DUF503 domain-containing protein [Anaerolineales bacterium]